VTPDARFWSPTGDILEFSDETLLEFIEEVSRKDTSPGLPWVSLGCKTIAQVLEKFPSVLCSQVRQRLRVRLSLPLEEARNKTPRELVELGYRDVVRVFIKNEPHNKKKFLSRRFRPIMNSSLTDIVCDRIVLEAIASAEVKLWDTIPSKAGMGLDDASIICLKSGLPFGGRKVFSSDAKAFDFHVSEWSMEAASEVEILQYAVPAFSDLTHLVRSSVVATMRKVWALSNGMLLAQVDPGIQESGSRMTACRNSKIRVLLALMAGALECVAMGDDALETWPNDEFDPQGNYARFGHEIEIPELPGDVEYEFCSTHFMRNGEAVPQSWARTVYRLLGHKPDRMLLEQFKYELRGLPSLPSLLERIAPFWHCD